MKQHINQRMAALAHSEIRAMTQACVQAKGLNMAQGVCDTPVHRWCFEPRRRRWSAGRMSTRDSMGCPNCGRRSPRSLRSTTASRLTPKRT